MSMRSKIGSAAQVMVVGLGLLSLGIGGCDSGAKDDGKAKTAAKGAKAGDAAGKGGAPAKVGEAPAKAEGGAVEAADDGGDEAEAEAEEEAPSEGDLVATLDKRVQRAAKLAKEIGSRPTEADDILDAADLDREGFEDLIYTIGADPALSKQYQVALASD